MIDFNWNLQGSRKPFAGTNNNPEISVPGGFINIDGLGRHVNSDGTHQPIIPYPSRSVPDPPPDTTRRRIAGNELVGPLGFWCHVRWVIFKLMSTVDDLDNPREIVLRWISLDLNDDNSVLMKAMARCRQATSQYLSQCWPRSRPPYGLWATMSQTGRID